MLCVKTNAIPERDFIKKNNFKICLLAVESITYLNYTFLIVVSCTCLFLLGPTVNIITVYSLFDLIGSRYWKNFHSYCYFNYLMAQVDKYNATLKKVQRQGIL